MIGSHTERNRGLTAMATKLSLPSLQTGEAEDRLLTHQERGTTGTRNSDGETDTYREKHRDSDREPYRAK